MSPDYEELQKQIAALARRVYELEQRLGLHETSARIPPKPTPATASTAGSEVESRIGGQWLNRIGIIAVLVGVSYFLKYAFDSEWVGPAVRVVIGLLSGLAVILWSEYVRRRGYAVFSYSLKAVGIGVLYLSLWTSSQLYHLVPNGLAFLAMATLTAATVAFALWQDAEVIAAFAALGAFITPVALSSGENNAVSLFAYVAILDIGALLLVWNRPWVRMLIGCYVGTLVLYSAWHSRFYTLDQFAIAIASVSVLFIVFALAPFIDARDRDLKPIALLALLNAGTYFFEVWELFEHAANLRRGAIAALGLAGLYLVMGYLLFNPSRTVLRQVHWSIAAAFAVAAVPIGLETPWITMGWFVEGAALIHASRKTNNNYLRNLAALAVFMAFARLIAVDQFEVNRLVFNARLTTFAVGILTLLYIAHHLKAADGQDGQDRQYERTATAIVVVAANVLALLALNEEITDAWRRQVQVSGPASYKTLGIIRDFAYSALWMSYGAGLIFIGFWKKSAFLRYQALILIAITVGKVFLYDTSSLDRGYRILSFIALGLLLLTTSFLYQRHRMNENSS
jgi:uncharacterized membrane protein